MASKHYGVNATIILFVFVLYCIITRPPPPLQIPPPNLPFQSSTCTNACTRTSSDWSLRTTKQKTFRGSRPSSPASGNSFRCRLKRKPSTFFYSFSLFVSFFFLFFFFFLFSPSFFFFLSFHNFLFSLFFFFFFFFFFTTAD